MATSGDHTGDMEVGDSRVPHATRAGDVLADRYRLVDLLSESGGGRFWRAHDRILERHVALHVIAADDPRADLLLDAARRSATVLDPRILRVLDAERVGDYCFVVNEWGSGTSLDIMLASNGPLSPRRGAWLVSEVADSIAAAHAHGVAHGLLSPENVLLDNAGSVRIIGFCVDAALHGLPPGDPQHDVVDLAGLLHATLTGRWAGRLAVRRTARAREARPGAAAPAGAGRRTQRPLDDLCDELLNPRGQQIRDVRDLASARGIQSFLADFVGDPTGLGPAIAAGNPEKNETVVLPAVPEILARPHPDDWVPPPEPEEPEPEPRARARAGSVEVPTQAGLPIFDDENDEVSWLRARDEPAPPPPPFEEPPERPLFAAGGRKPRYRRARTPGRWWRAATSTGPSTTCRSTGSGLIPAVDELDDTREQVPGPQLAAAGRCSSRSVLVLLVAIAIAFNLGRGKTPLGAEPERRPDPARRRSPPRPRRRPTPITGLTAADLDPQGDGEENPDDAPDAVDGDPATAWTTLDLQAAARPGRAQARRRAGRRPRPGHAVRRGRPDARRAHRPRSRSTCPTTCPTDPEEPDPGAQVQADGAARERRRSTRRPRPVPHDLAHLPPGCRRRLPGWDRGPRGGRMNAPAEAELHRPRAAAGARRRRPRRLRHPVPPAPRPALGGRPAHHGQPRGRRRRPAGRHDRGLPAGRLVPRRGRRDHLAAPGRGQRLPRPDPRRQGAPGRAAARRPRGLRRPRLAGHVDDRGRRPGRPRASSTSAGADGAGRPRPRCPADQRAALVLVDMEGYPVAEVAEMLDCAVGTVKSRCSRGRARLATLLGVLRPGGDPDHPPPGEPRPDLRPSDPRRRPAPRPMPSEPVGLIPSQPPHS